MFRRLIILLCFGFILGLDGQHSYADTNEEMIFSATWSPNGEFVSYLASDGIHVMDKNGDDNRVLVPPGGFGGWTADSSGIFIIENKNPLEGMLQWWIYPIDGADAFQFLPQLHSITAIAYSHDGQQIAISAQETDSDPFMIWVANADGTQLRSLAAYQVYDLGWSDDDTQIVFETLNDDAETREMIEVSLDINGNREPDIRPIVDGMRSIGDTLDFSYVTEMSYPPKTFYISDILDNQESVFTVNQWVAAIDYSEISRRMVYTAYCDTTAIDEAFLSGEWSLTEQETVETALYLVDLVTGEQTLLVDCGNGSQIAPSLSPDGQELLFIWINKAEWDLYRANLDETNFVNLTGE